jgi:peptidoglycan hydrolase-like protein with peptidoglycan-binding domain
MGGYGRHHALHHHWRGRPGYGPDGTFGADQGPDMTQPTGTPDMTAPPMDAPAMAPSTGAPGTGQGAEQVRWIQDCLNRVMSAQLPVDGVMSEDVRNIVRSFQQQQNLNVTGIVGPDTAAALQAACSGGQSAAAPPDAQPAPDAGGGAPPDAPPADGAAPGEFEMEGFLGDFFGRVGSGIRDAAGRLTNVITDIANAGIIDLTAKSDKSRRKGARDPKKIKQLVLHQMACCFKPADPLTRFLTVGAHFAITADGRILQLHPIEQLLWASNGFNGSSVAVEFAGNFPDSKGRWWEGDKYGRDRPTQAQFEAGRRLIRYLVAKIGLTQVVAHRQSSASRENDPGPEVWRNVGQWAVDTLGLSDGGPGFKLPGGNPIPDDWRKAPATGSSGTSHEMEWEAEFMHGAGCGCSRCRGGGGGRGYRGRRGRMMGEFEGESPLNEAEELELALELMGVSNEAEMEQFLGSLFKGAMKGIKKIGSVVGKVAGPLKGIIKTALPIVAPMVGSIVPGVGTALGGVLGNVVSQALELEGEMEQEEANFEKARRLVRIAATAARDSAQALGNGDPTVVVNQAVIGAARRHLPGVDVTILERAAGGRGQARTFPAHAGQGPGGQWHRQRDRIVLEGA